jgi:hypothetical protein
MNEVINLLISQQQNNLRSHFQIFPRDIDILSVARKATVIIGIRRCGKSTWQHEKMEALLDKGVSYENICYLDFSDDRLDALRLDSAKPSIISDTYYSMYPQKHSEKVYFFFDEIQYVNMWGSFINRIQSQENCEIYITGSSAKLLAKEISTELGGRVFSWEMFPYSFHEFLLAENKPQKISDISSRDEIIKGFNDYIIKGGMPERQLLPKESMAIKYFQNLVKDVITRDLILRYNISNPKQLYRLTQLLINNYSRLISINKLKQRLAGEKNKLSPELISDYIEKLNDSYLLFTVPIRSYNLAKQAVNPKKVYCIDHAMAHCFSASTSDSKGFILENMVFIQLRRSTEQIFYYKTNKGNEIDFAVGPDSNIKLIQVCYNIKDRESAFKREIRALFEGMEEFSLKESWLITAYEKDEIIDQKTGNIVHIVPAYSWLL